jgi:antitoxin (DNA-binding transcriptional repressor) of toxin-antitoxin stability system
MRKAVNIYQAKSQLSDMVSRAAAGEEFVIAKSGKPRALGTSSSSTDSPPAGRWQGQGVGGR